MSRYALRINFDRCKNCRKCTKVLPDFKRKYAGNIEVSEGALQRTDVQEGIDRVIKNCTENAITLDKID